MNNDIWVRIQYTFPEERYYYIREKTLDGAIGKWIHYDFNVYELNEDVAGVIFEDKKLTDVEIVTLKLQGIL